ncbi:RNA polymerase small subunit [Pseudomonas phage vB_Pae_AM.P2]|uniref:RNA polymerase small subunit n=1 Tax=Pseudomonas phage vB_Pae_AM.P2 TaxID=2731695 RepID=A0A7S5W9B9_9CAUD|nr:RNA polymerase small subunit [Pseudomonas phage vB_Pae_AM.P2]
MHPTHMLPEDMQRANEYRFARAHIDGYLRKFLQQDEDWTEVLSAGVALLEEYANKDHGYESKNLRMETVRNLDLSHITTEVAVASLYCQVPELFSSFTAKLAHVLGFDDKADSIKTIAEMVAVLCELDLYNLEQNERFGSWKVVSNIELPEDLMRFVERSQYLPPMVCAPATLTSNKQKLRLTCEAESLILNDNHHGGDICLDVLNLVNSVELCLNTEFLSTIEEEPNKHLENRDQQDDWMRFKTESHEMYKLMVQQGNKFYLLHKVDKRGRLYAQGYHISTQGASYKKAMIDLYNKEEVIGVPQHLRITK